MSSRAEVPADDAADLGLLSPVSTATAAEAMTGDRAVVAAMVRAEGALVRALVETKVAPPSAMAAAAMIDATEVDVRALALAATEGGNPVIPLVEQLRASVVEVEWVHFGATSQDILDTALMLVASDVTQQIEADLTTLASTLATLVEQNRAVPLVARTLTQQALPSTLGMRASGWLAGVHDAVRVVRTCTTADLTTLASTLATLVAQNRAVPLVARTLTQQALPSTLGMRASGWLAVVHDAVRAVRTCTTLPISLGGPVGTTSAYGADGPAVVETFARLLGQRAPVSSWHTRRTPVVGLASALTIAGETCGKIAADLLVMSQSEVGEARETTGGSSSAMPHKANPAQSVLVASAARQLPALASVIASSAAAEQERPAGAWHAEWQPLRTMLRLSGAAVERTTDLVASVRFDHEAMRRNLDLLVTTLGEDEAWVTSHIEHVDVWIDRVLAQHADVFA